VLAALAILHNEAAAVPPEIKFPGFAAVEPPIVKEARLPLRILHVQSIGLPASRGEEETAAPNRQTGSRGGLFEVEISWLARGIMLTLPRLVQY